MENPVRTETRGRVLLVTLDRPKANAIDAATSRALGSAFVAFRDDPELRVAVVTAPGERFFSAGWDLKAAADGEQEWTDHGPGGFAGLTELWDLEKPVIAAVNGLAVGGGLELALACDLILAAEHVEFFLPETTVGNMADAGGVQRLPRRLPWHVAMEMLLTGRRMGAAEAARWGLVNEVLPVDRLLPRALELAEDLARRAPLSVQAIKQVVRGIEAMTVREAFAAIKRGDFPIYDRMLASEDHREGPRAFAEKRAPEFKGR